MSLGSEKFFTPIETLPNERVVWEGGPSLISAAIALVRWGFLLGFIGIFFVGVMLLGSDGERRPKRSTEQAEKLTPGELAAWRARVRWVATLVLSGIGGASLAVVALSAILRNRWSWYIITTERVCIQRGGFSRELAIFDLDKVVSVHATASVLQRLVGLQSITLVQAGVTLVRRQNVLDRFGANSLEDVPVTTELLGRFLNEWLPRDNRS